MTTFTFGLRTDSLLISEKVPERKLLESALFLSRSALFRNYFGRSRSQSGIIISSGSAASVLTLSLLLHSRSAIN